MHKMCTTAFHTKQTMNISLSKLYLFNSIMPVSIEIIKKYLKKFVVKNFALFPTTTPNTSKVVSCLMCSESMTLSIQSLILV